MTIDWKKPNEAPTKRWANNKAISEEYLVAYNGKNGFTLNFCSYSYVSNDWIVIPEFGTPIVAWAEITREEFELAIMLEFPNL